MLQHVIRRLRRRPPTLEARARYLKRKHRKHKYFTKGEIDEVHELMRSGHFVPEENMFLPRYGHHPFLHGTWIRTGVAA